MSNKIGIGWRCKSKKEYYFFAINHIMYLVVPNKIENKDFTHVVYISSKTRRSEGKIGIGWKIVDSDKGEVFIFKIDGQKYFVVPNKFQDRRHNFDFVVYPYRRVK